MHLSDLVNMRTIVSMFIIIRTIVRLIAKRVKVVPTIKINPCTGMFLTHMRKLERPICLFLKF